MRCKGKCEKQESRVRKLKVKVVPDPKNPKGCKKNPPDKVIQKAAKALKKEREGVDVLIPCKDEEGKEDKNCDCSGIWSKWGNPLNGKKDVPVTVKKCKYTLNFTYKIQGRKLEGVCVTTGGADQTC